MHSIRLSRRRLNKTMTTHRHKLDFELDCQNLDKARELLSLLGPSKQDALDLEAPFL